MQNPMNVTADLETVDPYHDADQRYAAAGTSAGIEQVRTEILDHTQLTARTHAWRALIGRALEPNVFLEPGFILPLLQNATGYSRLCFLAVWLETDEAPQLIGLLAFYKPRFKWTPLLQAATTHHSPLGTPLLDRDYAALALKAFCSGLKKHFPLAAALHLPFLPIKGPAFYAMAAFAAVEGAEISFIERFSRAGLFAPTDPQSLLSSKRRKFYRQQKRQLEKLGHVIYQRASASADVAKAAEEFLALEARGWKGKRQTDFLSSPQQSAFFRAMIETMAVQGKCRIDSLRLDGQPIAIAILLTSEDGAAFWKTAFDERFSWLSPGVQLTLELTRFQLTEASTRLTDSCAVPDHPMINQIWRQRIGMADALLPLRSKSESYPWQKELLELAVFFTLLPSKLRRMAKILLEKVVFASRRSRPAIWQARDMSQRNKVSETGSAEIAAAPPVKLAGGGKAKTRINGRAATR